MKNYNVEGSQIANVSARKEAKYHDCSYDPLHEWPIQRFLYCHGGVIPNGCMKYICNAVMHAGFCSERTWTKYKKDAKWRRSAALQNITQITN